MTVIYVGDPIVMPVVSRLIHLMLEKMLKPETSQDLHSH